MIIQAISVVVIYYNPKLIGKIKTVRPTVKFRNLN